MAHLSLDPNVVSRCRELARRIAEPVEKLIATHTTVAIERATLRLLGVNGAIIQMNAMVTHLARVGPGVTIPSGRKVKPGKWVRSNDEVESKTDEVTKEDRKFMHDVVHVNVAFAEEYPKLAKENRTNVRGINYNPSTEFNEQSRLPTLEGVPTRDPGFRNRIIGDVKIKKDNLGQLNKVMGSQISLRADEGHPFEVDSIAEMSDHVTFHALEFTSMHLGANGTYGPYSLVHGGELKEDLGGAARLAGTHHEEHLGGGGSAARPGRRQPG